PIPPRDVLPIPAAEETGGGGAAEGTARPERTQAEAPRPEPAPAPDPAPELQMATPAGDGGARDASKLQIAISGPAFTPGEVRWGNEPYNPRLYRCSVAFKGAGLIVDVYRENDSVCSLIEALELALAEAMKLRDPMIGDPEGGAP